MFTGGLNWVGEYVAILQVLGPLILNLRCICKIVRDDGLLFLKGVEYDSLASSCGGAPWIH